MSKHVLVTNDDGFDSFFLRILVDRLLEKFTVTVVAPAEEQSWVGRGITRIGNVKVIADDSLGCPGWRVHGTPTDCVNLAMEHLLEEAPAAVLSGINLGFNTTIPLILSSGTIAGALEGAFQGLPAMAFSKIIPKPMFDEVRANNGFVEGAYFQSLEYSTAKAVALVSDLISGRLPSGDAVVHNINFPVGVREHTQIVRTVPVPMRMAGLFAKTAGNDYEFQYRQGLLPDDRPGTDIHALEEGHISHSIIDFSRIGVPL